MPIETERKYLIAYPDTDALSRMAGARRIVIRQTYLTAQPSVTARVRRAQEGDEVRWYYTEKRRISSASAYEDEREITPEEADRLLMRADPALSPIEKIRWRVPIGMLAAEIDLYPFWRDRAVMEIELPDETCEVPEVPFVTVLRDVTDDPRYKNRALARAIPHDAL